MNIYYKAEIKLANGKDKYLISPHGPALADTVDGGHSFLSPSWAEEAVETWGDDITKKYGTFVTEVIEIKGEE